MQMTVRPTKVFKTKEKIYLHADLQDHPIFRGDSTRLLPVDVHFNIQHE